MQFTTQLIGQADQLLDVAQGEAYGCEGLVERCLARTEMGVTFIELMRIARGHVFLPADTIVSGTIVHVCATCAA